MPAIRADLLRQLGRGDEALVESERAIELTRNEAERQYLDAQIPTNSVDCAEATREVPPRERRARRERDDEDAAASPRPDRGRADPRARGRPDGRRRPARTGLGGADRAVTNDGRRGPDD